MRTKITFDTMVLVTGGTGLVGAHVLFELVNSGNTVRALQRENSSKQVVKDLFNFYSPKGTELYNSISWVTGDVEDVFSLEKIVSGCDAVFHCAAVVSFSSSDLNSMLKTNVEGTKHLVDICLSENVKEFYYVSSVAAMGRNAKTQSVNETAEWENSKENSGYAISKYQAEMEVWRGGEEGLNVAMVNPTIVIGPGQTQKSSGTIMKSISSGQKYYTAGENGYVDARDVAFILKLLYDQKIFGERYVLCGENLSYKEAGDLMAKHLQVKPPTILAKPWLTSLAWRSLAIVGFFTRKRQLLTKETAQSSHRKTTYENDKARNELGVTFRTAEQAIKNAVAFFKKHPEHL